MSWSLPLKSVLETLRVDSTQGLSSDEIDRRRSIYGANQLREAARTSGWRILWDQLASPIVALLVVATGVAIAFDEQLEAGAIAAVLVVNTLIGFSTERRALRAVEALRELGSRNATVRRSGGTRSVSATELVPGDIVLLEAGDVLTADLRIISASKLQADESTLTGESLAIDKSTTPTSVEAALPDRTSMLYSGTALTRGSGEGVVVEIGMATELGKISRLVAEAEPEQTPLKERLDRLGRRLIFLTLGIASLVAVTGVWAGRDLYVSIEIALALAIAAVPEGLPIVATVALARGMWRMARRNALVQKLSAVETLGSTTVLLVDKTGTLTENRMVVGEMALPDGHSARFDPHHQTGAVFLRDRAIVDLSSSSPLSNILRIAALCNNAEIIESKGGQEESLGDPTEIALLSAAKAAGQDRKSLLEASPEIREIAFDSESKRMATLHQDGGAILAAIKGAPEAILPDCTYIGSIDGDSRPFDSSDQGSWLDRASSMASSGQRVLAIAFKPLRDADDFSFHGMTLLGLIGLVDPPRSEVRSAIAACREAGIRTVMVTGDHGGTAWHIGRATGLIRADQSEAPTFLDARTLPNFMSLSIPDARRLLDSPIIARATPTQKLDLISLYQKQGDVVAMTGDGVNDAPALKKADIGVAMGMRGTQVAREAADMVLQDDDLRTITVAVSQGRSILSNIRKFVLYLLSCNLSEILAVAGALFAQIPLPLLPLQILFLNLVTDVFPALALGVGDGGSALMHRRPRKASESLVTRRNWIRILAMGGVMAAAVLGALILAQETLEKSPQQATTISFLTLALAQLWHVFSMREIGSGFLRNEITGNPWIWGALGLCLALIASSVLWTPLARTLSISHPGGNGCGLAILMSLIPLVVGQIELSLRRPTSRLHFLGIDQRESRPA